MIDSAMIMKLSNELERTQASNVYCVLCRPIQFRKITIVYNQICLRLRDVESGEIDWGLLRCRRMD
jgi:hypothetical protein